MQEEDKNSIDSLEVLRGKEGAVKSVGENESLYEQLQDRTSPIFLKLNSMLYKFDTNSENACTLDLKEST